MNLNGADAKCAMLWFLCREKQRHQLDIQRIEIDIDALIRQGAVMPDSPDLYTFIKVPGVDYVGGE